MATEYGSSPVAQPGTQTRNGASASFASNERGDDFRLQSAEGVRVAEETGHAYQEIASELLDLLRMFAQVGKVVRDVIEVAEPHAPFQPPREHFLAIEAKIELRAGTQESQQLVQMVRGLIDRGDDPVPLDVAVLHVIDERFRHLLDGQDIVGQARGDGALRHAG